MTAWRLVARLCVLSVVVVVVACAQDAAPQGPPDAEGLIVEASGDTIHVVPRQPDCGALVTTTDETVMLLDGENGLARHQIVRVWLTGPVAESCPIQARAGAVAITEPDATGIDGTAVAGPQCPVEREGSPCPDLAVDAELQVMRDGQVVAEVRTGPVGRFWVELPPGDYEIRTSGNAPPFLEPQQVTVPEDGFATVELRLDTGIR